ncbi:hypothetical protein PPS11_42309 [Pseudomonas putida S11]|nr:hypothetical protein PPS11_42309 [Pseudomonas putida S11]
MAATRTCWPGCIEGEQLATDFPGYLGSGILAPPRDSDEFQIIFRFSDEPTLHAWEHSASRRAWLQRGNGLFERPKEARVSGIDDWFGTNMVTKTTTLEAGCGHLAGLLPGLAGVQPGVRPLARCAGPGTTGTAQHPWPDAGDGLPVHPPVHPFAGRLAACVPRPCRRPAQPLRPGRTRGRQFRVCWAATKGQTS